MPKRYSDEEILRNLPLAESSPLNWLDVLHCELKAAEPSDHIVERLVSMDTDLLNVTNEQGSVALHVACSNIQFVSFSTLRFIIEKSPQALKMANSLGFLPIHKAVGNYKNDKCLKAIKYIAEQYPSGLASRTKDGQTPLHIAVSTANLFSVALIEMLVDLYPDALMSQDNYGQFPLHRAASKPKIDPGIVHLLLERAPDIAPLKDKNG